MKFRLLEFVGKEAFRTVPGVTPEETSACCCTCDSGGQCSCVSGNFCTCVTGGQC